MSICGKVKKIFKKKPKPIPVTHGEIMEVPLKVAEEYLALWTTMELSGKGTFPWYVKRYIPLIDTYRPQYAEIARVLHAPWQVVAVIHMREASCNIDCNLMNGQLWWKRTTNVPKGYGPWKNFVEAGIAAFLYEYSVKGRPANWNLTNTLWFLEQFNGLGYRRYHPSVNTPYLWGLTNHYVKGGYVSDGSWSSSYVNKQCGCAPFLKELGFTE